MSNVNGKFAEGLTALLTDISKLDSAENNPRRGDVEAVARSYNTFGQRKPIVVRRVSAERGTVIAGNHQLRAAKQLGWTHIAAIWVDEDEATSRAFALADNRTHDMGTYDTAALVAMLEEVQGEESLLAATAYSEDDLADLAARLEEESEDLDLDALLSVNERFSRMASRTLVIELSNEQFVWAQERLARYRAQEELESNAEALVKALETANRKKAPEWS